MKILEKFLNSFKVLKSSQIFLSTIDEHFTYLHIFTLKIAMGK